MDFGLRSPSQILKCSRILSILPCSICFKGKLRTSDPMFGQTRGNKRPTGQMSFSQDGHWPASGWEPRVRQSCRCEKRNEGTAAEALSIFETSYCESFSDSAEGRLSKLTTTDLNDKWIQMDILLMRLRLIRAPKFGKSQNRSMDRRAQGHLIRAVDSSFNYCNLHQSQAKLLWNGLLKLQLYPSHATLLVWLLLFTFVDVSPQKGRSRAGEIIYIHG